MHECQTVRIRRGEKEKARYTTKIFHPQQNCQTKQEQWFDNGVSCSNTTTKLKNRHSSCICRNLRTFSSSLVGDSDPALRHRSFFVPTSTTGGVCLPVWPKKVLSSGNCLQGTKVVSRPQSTQGCTNASTIRSGNISTMANTLEYK